MNLCILELSAWPFVSATLTINIVSSTKRLRLNEKYSTLWHIVWVIILDKE